MRRQRQSGAALLMAMLTVALVATLASAALWQHWRQVEIETAERGRSQTAWMMTGALDWTRLILNEDAKTPPNVDHLSEPWALPVQESKLSTFLSQDQQWREGDPDVFLSGQISDAQAKLNVLNLLEDGKPSAKMLARWALLFDRLSLPQSELQALATQLSAAQKADPAVTTTPLMPQRAEQLVWLGLSPATLNALMPFITVLPGPTPVNLNTAPAEVLAVCLPGLDWSAARALVNQRERGHWTTLEEVRQALGKAGPSIDDQQHSINSSYFEVRGRMRIDNVVQQDLALVKRDNGQVRMLWRVRSPVLSHTPPLQ
jgi:general secretion pathway protein K